MKVLEKLEWVQKNFPNLNHEEQILYMDGWMDGYTDGLLYAKERIRRTNEQDSETDTVSNEEIITNDTP